MSFGAVHEWPRKFEILLTHRDTITRNLDIPLPRISDFKIAGFFNDNVKARYCIGDDFDAVRVSFRAA